MNQNTIKEAVMRNNKKGLPNFPGRKLTQEMDGMNESITQKMPQIKMPKGIFKQMQDGSR